ncbi:MAG: response regulator [Planctomycetaceae bacterium]|nr:response regulator [Planctomycetaceae bacterium]
MADSSPIVHLLIVEDDANDVLVLKRAFDRLGVACQISFAISGQEAVELLSSRSTSAETGPTHVLLDLKLPKMPGLEVLRWIRQQPGLERLPVVVFSSSNLDADVQAARKLGVDSFRVKPLSFAESSRMVEEIARAWGLL